MLLQRMTRYGLVTTSRRYLLCVCIVSTIFVFVLTKLSLVYNTTPTKHNRDDSSENPSIYLQSRRFDVIVKMVYAYFYVYKSELPQQILQAYLDHLRVWNHFKEHCSNIKKTWFDGKIPCKNKLNQSDFISSFHKTIDDIKENGFNSSVSKIPLDNTGFLMNGAHRISAAVVLSQNASFEHHQYKQNAFHWDYTFFIRRGMSQERLNIVVLEWMKIQMTLPYLKSFVFIVSVLSNNNNKDKAMRKIVEKQCSKDNSILYKVEVNFTRNGMQQLVTHMYGHQPRTYTKLKKIMSRFNSTYIGKFLFIFTKGIKHLDICKTRIRKLYNDTDQTFTVHIPETIERNLILAEMILNSNSIQFMNYAKNASECYRIANEMARRYINKPKEALQGIFIGRDDVMVDSGAVLAIYGIRKRTDVNLLFLHEIIQELALHGEKRKIVFQVHAFKENSISKGRALGEDHFGSNVTANKWALFYDPHNFGYCYGIKFVSLEQLIRYKRKRHDLEVVQLINNFYKSIV